MKKKRKVKKNYFFQSRSSRKELKKRAKKALKPLEMVDSKVQTSIYNFFSKPKKKEEIFIDIDEIDDIVQEINEIEEEDRVEFFVKTKFKNPNNCFSIDYLNKFKKDELTVNRTKKIQINGNTEGVFNKMLILESRKQRFLQNSFIIENFEHESIRNLISSTPLHETLRHLSIQKEYLDRSCFTDSIDLCNNGIMLALGTTDKRLFLYNTLTKNVIKQYEPDGLISDLHFIDNNIAVSYYTKDMIEIFDRNFTLVDQLKLSASINSFVNMTNNVLGLACRDGKFRVYDMRIKESLSMIGKKKEKRVRKFEMGKKRRRKSLNIGFRGKKKAITKKKRKLEISFSKTKQKQEFKCIEFSESNNIVFLGNVDSSVIAYDIRNAQAGEIKIFDIDKIFSGFKKSLVCDVETKKLKTNEFISVEEDYPFHRQTDKFQHIEDLKFDPISNNLFFLSKTGKCGYFNIYNEEPIKLYCHTQDKYIRRSENKREKSGCLIKSKINPHLNFYCYPSDAGSLDFLDFSNDKKELYEKYEFINPNSNLNEKTTYSMTNKEKSMFLRQVNIGRNPNCLIYDDKRERIFCGVDTNQVVEYYPFNK